MGKVSRKRLPHWAGFFLLAFTSLLALFAYTPAAFAAAAAKPAEAFVQQTIDKGYVILNNDTLMPDQRRAQFRTFMMETTDTKRIGMFTLGQYANGASKGDIDAFAAAFTDYMVAVYESRLSKYKGQTLKVTGSSERTADDAIVNADVVNPNTTNGQPLKVAFRVRKSTEGRSIVTDIQVEGVWLALSQRSDFVAFLQQHGGKVPALTDNLKMQTGQIHADAGMRATNGNFKS